MVNAGRVNVLETAQDLVQEELDVIVRQRLRRLDDLREVRLHQLGHYIYFIEAGSVLRLKNSLDTEDVFVVQEPLNFELAVSTQRENAMLECLHDFLDGDQVVLAFHLLIPSGHDDTIGTLPDGINNFIALVNFELSVNDHVRVRCLGWVLIGQQDNLRFLLVVLSFFSVLRWLHVQLDVYTYGSAVF